MVKGGETEKREEGKVEGGRNGNRENEKRNEKEGREKWEEKGKKKGIMRKGNEVDKELWVRMERRAEEGRKRREGREG